MGYNVADIIDKAIDISIRRRKIHENIGQEKCDILSIKIMSNVLIKEMDRTIEYYEALLKEINEKEFEEIDFSIYDKMSFLINNFNKRIAVVEITNVREYLNFSLGLEQSVYSLLMDIQGRFVKNTNDIYTKTYRILSDIIDNKAKHIAMLEKALE
ncbi:hypothetical protein [Desulfosporosinus sp. OT]|uniref:hypothetical protein n=1 Tax=Desulfosporosinus sp. OT TaxID=913865 RepID=UPI000223A9A7|nr:hypothetical protein [Desulfosporosinus sp. OT]EGW36292.1 hypothetical protein DOT_5798 [Desulfosporosinus sp. OT]